MKKKILAGLLVMIAAFAVIAQAAPYNWGNTDLIPLLQYVFNTSTGHNHDGVNSRLITTLGAITSGTIDGVIIGGTTKAAGSFTALVATGAFTQGSSGQLTVDASGNFATSGTVGGSVITATTNFAGSFKSGTGSGTYVPSGVMQVSTTSTGNGADTTEDTLVTYSLPANTLSANGKGVRVRAWGTTAANADNKTIKLYFGAAVITTPTAGTNNKNWWLDLVVVRSGSSTQAVLGSGQVDTTMVTPYFNAATETDTGAIVIKTTGTAGTANANDILIKGFVVEMLS